MSACSEACYHAAWLDGTQDELPVVAERVLTTPTTSTVGTWLD